ncbi:MAG: hypothetical protein QNJ97_22900 [Myxococcota bacterium]|nr:hypothetical protein [Myxococcota bacterium]
MKHTQVALRAVLAIGFFFLQNRIVLANQPDNPSQVLVIKVAQNDPAKQVEDKFITQLALSLPQFRVTSIVETGAFIELSLTDRLEKIKQFAKTHNALATLWIEGTRGNVILLNLVALSTGQALVRIVEAPEGPNWALEMALATQELLGQAYLFSQVPRREAVEQVVTQMTRRAVTTLDNPRAVTSQVSFPAVSIYPRGVVQRGLYGHSDSYWMLGGGIAAEVWPRFDFFLRADVYFLKSPVTQGDWGQLSAFGLQPGLGIGYVWRIRRFLIGPIIAGNIIWHRANVSLYASAENRAYAVWIPRLATSVVLGVGVADNFFISVEPGIGLLQKQEDFYLDPGETVYRTPYVDWSLALGLNLFL